MDENVDCLVKLRNHSVRQSTANSLKPISDSKYTCKVAANSQVRKPDLVTQKMHQDMPRLDLSKVNNKTNHVSSHSANLKPTASLKANNILVLESDENGNLENPLL